MGFVTVDDGPKGLITVSASRPLSLCDGVLDVRSNAAWWPFPPHVIRARALQIQSADGADPEPFDPA